MYNFPIDYSISLHEKKILDYFGEENVVNKKSATEPNDLNHVFICFTNRCGSNYLAEVIQSTEYFPSAGEFFNWDTVVNNSEKKNLRSLDMFCIKLINERKSNDFFISKVGFFQLFMLSKYGQIPNIFNNPKFIWIKRKDVVSQAVSLVIADQTKKWTSYHQSSDEITPVYNMESIMRSVRAIVHANTMFETYFKLFNAAYLEILYEDFCEKPIEHMDNICSFLQQDSRKPIIETVRTKVQRNTVNQEFKSRFLEDMGSSFSLNLEVSV